MVHTEKSIIDTVLGRRVISQLLLNQTGMTSYSLGKIIYKGKVSQVLDKLRRERFVEMTNQKTQFGKKIKKVYKINFYSLTSFILDNHIMKPFSQEEKKQVTKLLENINYRMLISKEMKQHVPAWEIFDNDMISILEFILNDDNVIKVGTKLYKFPETLVEKLTFISRMAKSI